jgi:urease accessory protein
VAVVGGRSVVVERRARSPLRLLSPANAGPAAWIYTSSFGGGLVDGDDLRLEVEVDDGATALLATQASTKAYRAPHGTRSELRARVGAGATLVVLADPLVPFAGARVETLLELELGAGATLAAVDAVTAGRLAHGERWSADRVQTRIRIRREGALLLDDGLLLDPAHGELRRRLGRFDALATVVLLGPRLAPPAEPHRSQRAELVESAAPLGDGLLVRLAATSPATLAGAIRRTLSAVPQLLGDDPFARRW